MKYQVEVGDVYHAVVEDDLFEVVAVNPEWNEVTISNGQDEAFVALTDIGLFLYVGSVANV